MRKLTREDLMSLERYHAERPAFRKQAIAHKSVRQVALGPHVTLTFEDFTTIQYQVQEMLRIERIFEIEAIQQEMDAYNPLIPEGDNWKATMMIEYEDVDERRVALEALHGVEDRVWVRAGSMAPIFAFADEDMERSRDNKTAAVHFLRFPLTPEAIAALKTGAPLGMGVDHPHYSYECSSVAASTRESLLRDLA